MAGQNRAALLLLILGYIWGSYLIGNAKVTLKEWENCDQNKNYKARYNFTLKTVHDLQYIDGTFTYLAPIDNHIRVDVRVDTLVGKQYVYLFTVTERKFCDCLNKYFGELWYDLERHAQIIPGQCPIPQGRYHLHNVLMDFSKMPTLSTFPSETLRATCMLYDKDNSIFSCILLEAEIII